ncbi:MAG: YlxR family protein [Ilumatobacteraceae bacterium]|nr:YlxR family protein [Ilumatobacteraceae bacterium]
MSAVAGPHRTCVGCRRRHHVDALVRVTHSDGRIDVGGASCGRGAWVCTSTGRPDAACVRSAIKRNGFHRAWRVDRRTLDDDELWRVLAPGD